MTKFLAALTIYALSAASVAGQSGDTTSAMERALAICAATKISANCRCVPYVDDNGQPRAGIECDDDV